MDGWGFEQPHLVGDGSANGWGVPLNPNFSDSVVCCAVPQCQMVLVRDMSSLSVAGASWPFHPQVPLLARYLRWLDSQDHQQ